MNGSLYNRIPEAAQNYCESLRTEFPFDLKLASKRKTKSGDYTYVPATKSHRISINKDLNPYGFLITYIHEVAHLVAFEKHGRKIQPHGTEWKSLFRELMLPVLHPEIFPDAILRALSSHLRNPSASTYSDQRLVRCLRAYDAASDDVSLESLPVGSRFVLNGKSFEKMETRRTRTVCKQISTNKKYLVSKVTLVKVESSLLF